jgi:hypothetical protein
MKARVYRDAAVLIAEGKEDRACWAIEKAQGDTRHAHTLARRKFVEVMLDGCEYSSYLFPRYGDSLRARHERVMLLLFAYQLERTGDL